MNYTRIKIKEGINLHEIKTNKFKTNLLAIFLRMPLDRQTVTKNALVAAILRRGSKNMPSQEIISEKLEDMYGADFDCGIEKNGDMHTLKFYLESIDDEFLPEKEPLLKKSLDILTDIVFNPLTENDCFKKEYVESEKTNLKQIIESKIDNKAVYAMDRCIEEMYKNKAFGLYRFGYIEDLDKIDSKGLYEYYKELIDKCEIDIFVSGKLEQDIESMVRNNEKISALKQRNNDFENEKKDIVESEKIVEEKMDVTQGKLVIGMDINSDDANMNYIAMCYNAILGGGANSKMFQNVREKAGLAYTVGSMYIKRKDNIIIRAGIEINNYDKAIEIIKKQLDDMRKGNFTQEDLDNAKNLIVANIDNIQEEQDTEISYYFGQEMSKTNVSVEEYKEKVLRVTKQEIVDIANNISINTIYFLRN